jgi:hypothetical protein
MNALLIHMLLICAILLASCTYNNSNKIGYYNDAIMSKNSGIIYFKANGEADSSGVDIAETYCVENNNIFFHFETKSFPVVHHIKNKIHAGDSWSYKNLSYKISEADPYYQYTSVEYGYDFEFSCEKWQEYISGNYLYSEANGLALVNVLVRSCIDKTVKHSISVALPAFQHGKTGVCE